MLKPPTAIRAVNSDFAVKQIRLLQNTIIIEWLHTDSQKPPRLECRKLKKSSEFRVKALRDSETIISLETPLLPINFISNNSAYRRHTTFEAGRIELKCFWNHHVIFTRILARCNCWHHDLPDAECSDEGRESTTKGSNNKKQATGAWREVLLKNCKFEITIIYMEWM